MNSKYNTKEIFGPEKTMEGCVAWESPSNIALVKYWGKHGRQLPRNPSLSFTLNHARTKTEINFFRLVKGNGPQLDFRFEGKANASFESRIQKYLDSLHDDFPFLKDYALIISSSNTFPHSAGIASSASAMSALALCLVSMEEKVTGQKLNEAEFFRKASQVARLGSGSAARSVYGGFVAWGESRSLGKSADEYALSVNRDIHPLFQELQDAIMVVDASPKKVSSSKGHALMDDHPYAQVRFEQAEHNFGALLKILENGDWNAFVELVENEALSLHALMMNSNPSYTLLHPNTLIGIEQIRDFRVQTGVKICFTLDAGPNLHLLFPISEKLAVKKFIEENFVSLLDNKNWLADGIGKGPERLK